MTNPWFLGVAGALLAIGGLHSILGERLLIGPVLARLPTTGGRLAAGFERRTLRFAWHLTTLAWWAFAGFAAWASRAPIDAGARAALGALAVLLAASALVVAVASRAAHFAWPVFAAAACFAVVGLEGPDWVRASGISTVAAWVVATVTAALALLHVRWAIGRRGPGASNAVVPTRADGAPLFSPGKVSTLAVAGALAVAAVASLAAAGAVEVPFGRDVARVLAALAALAFLARSLGDFRYVGFFKRVVGTSFARWDTRLYTPLSAALGALLAISAL